MKWWWSAWGRSFVTAWMVVLLGAGVAQAGTSWGDGLLTVSMLDAGTSFESSDGAFTFSDFEFTAVGFDESAFDDYLAAPRDTGFRLILGFGGAPFSAGSTIGMSYTVTPNGPFSIGSASIPLFAILAAMGMDPLAELDWEASNGATMQTSVTSGGFIEDVSTSFGPAGSLRVSQLVSLSGVEAIVKVENAFGPVNVPEPGTGVLLAFGVGAAAVAAQRRRAR